ncbi:glycerol-3-phosphate cytidylyltransferase [Gammaproteobacteria bacterium LSUCC0057]|uniref:Glycerol-3-phosphate cytidylyltransferase n=1 Tax=Gammaproteobacteria bacterium LSUCC0057 TaxID=2559237 RepID=A0A4Y8UPV1_9GAMM|nr:glycerol-3-phosphate cytidylyltransferase [Gammaproteobacteria bacterium LSUCC0057]
MKKIGYTTGVFDMFHVGHLNIFRRAKLECDYLVVGVTTDELSIKTKNKKPIIPLNERIEIVNAIKFVDEVVTQEDYDKMKAWNTIKFDIMFVGDDWKKTEKWNNLEQKFSEVGVEIMYFPYTTNTSSTILRQVLTSIHDVI